MQRHIWNENIKSTRMHTNEDPQAHVAKIAEAVHMLACLKVYRYEKETYDAITRGLSKDCETEPCAPLRQPGLYCAAAESILGSDTIY